MYEEQSSQTNKLTSGLLFYYVYDIILTIGEKIMDNYEAGYNKGYRDGMNNKSYQNPYPNYSDAYDGYYDAYDIGEQDREIERG